MAAIFMAPLWLAPGGDVHAAPRLVVSGELGPELDTNPGRLSGRDTQVNAPLLRVVTRAELSWQHERHFLAAMLGGAGKLYLTEEGRLADELVQQASAEWRLRLRSGTFLRLDGGYYDAFLRPGAVFPRDFRTGRAAAALELVALRLRGVLKLGYSGLEFKPDAQYSYHGLFLGLSLQRALTSGRGDATAEWTLGAGYRAMLRIFGGLAQIAAPCSASGSFDCTKDGDTARRDINHVAHIDLDYLGDATGSLSYSLELNRSNGLGESYLRHAISLKFTAPLPLALFLTAQVVLQLSQFGDALFSKVATQSFADTDSENRSRLLLYLSRDFSKHWSVALRYSLYVNESGTTSSGVALPGFFRQTVFLGVRFEYDSDG